jgi:hypothetical protein
MSRIEDLKKQGRERRWAPTTALQRGETELRALAHMLWDADHENGRRVRYGYLDWPDLDQQMTALVTMIQDDTELARFVRDEHGIIEVCAGAGVPQRFANRHDAFDAAVKCRIARQGLLR